MIIVKKSQKHLENKLPFVLYKKPKSAEIQGFFQNTATLYATENYQTPGFVFAPFNKNFPTYIFPKEECEYFTEELTNKFSLDTKKNFEAVANSTLKDHHLKLVKKGIRAINEGALQKVVLSRKEEVPSARVDIISTFLALCTLYPSAFVYVWYHPKESAWLGATPETLINIKKDFFYTTALASTQEYKGTLDVEWGEKENEEHQLVVDFIKQGLQRPELLIKKFYHSKPFTVKAGNLLHLQTDFTAIFESKYLKKMIEILHPTPAVSGFPRQEAKEFIIKNEMYNREFYTGFLGEVALDCSTEFYVNLRCMQVVKNKAYIYVGGGITKDSDPKREWEETISKAQTIKKGIRLL